MIKSLILKLNSFVEILAQYLGKKECSISSQLCKKMHIECTRDEFCHTDDYDRPYGFVNRKNATIGRHDMTVVNLVVNSERNQSK